MNTIRHVEVSTLVGILPHVVPHLERALEQAPEYSMDDILESVIQQNSELFTIDDGVEIVGVVVTRKEAHPQRTYLQIHLLGGTGMKDWVEDLRLSMRQYAEALGYDGVILYGRPGWKKIFPDLKCERVVLIDEIGV